MMAHFALDYTLFGYCLYSQAAITGWGMFAYYLLSQFSAGLYIHLIFMYNHQQLPMMSKELQHCRDPCFARLQVQTCVNYSPNPLMSYLTLGLNFQGTLSHPDPPHLSKRRDQPPLVRSRLADAHVDVCFACVTAVEHHLFPEIPRRNLHIIQPRVEGFCVKHKLPYRVCSHYEAILEMNTVLRKASEIEDGFPWMNHLIAEHFDCMAE